MDAINSAASLLTFLTLLIVFKEEVQRVIKVLFERTATSKPPVQRESFFYLLFFWAVVASLLGGLFWNVAFSGTLGGPQSEPHSMAAMIWPIATNLPVAITLIILNRRYHLGIQNQVQLYLAFLAGMAVGSVVFYDLPLSRSYGFRQYFDSRNMPFAEKEFWLVVIWTSLLTILGFLPMGLTRLLFTPTPKGVRTVVWTFLKQTGLCIGLTTSAVSLFIWAFGDQPRFDSARGIIAGLFLRVAVFYGLFIGSYTGEAIGGTRHSSESQTQVN